MNRDIKFRGIDVRTNEFIYGYYFKSEDKEYITMPHPETKYADYAIRSGTSGQCTGLKDKNEKEIYEGDVVKAKINNEYYVSHQVTFYRGCFTVASMPFNVLSDFEVTGNIYENKELLED